jgi:D-glycero-D-manno-heptose 1,7-bisphosphate phosphatase
MKTSGAAVFLDRDGVLIEDRGLLSRLTEIRVLDDVPMALRRLKEAGFRLVVITNQAIVARGLITELDLESIHAEMCRMLSALGAPPLDAIYYCPHHPDATLPQYRIACDCRKPRPGSLLRAAEELHLDLKASFVIGDRMTDIIAGSKAGCRTVLIQGPKHADPPIVTVEPLDDSCRPDHTCDDLPDAVNWIMAAS